MVLYICRHMQEDGTDSLIFFFENGALSYHGYKPYRYFNYRSEISKSNHGKWEDIYYKRN